MQKSIDILNSRQRIDLDHRYLRKVDCSSFVMCPLLVLPFQRAFLRQPLAALTRQTMQAVSAINQPIFTMMSMIQTKEGSSKNVHFCKSVAVNYRALIR